MTQLDHKLRQLQHLRRADAIKPGLQTMQNLMKALDNPEQAFPTIHIAGTNGKGSTAAFLASALQETNNENHRQHLPATSYQLQAKIGLYTSPYLREFNERIKINGNMASDEQLISLISKVQAAAQHARLNPTYFEFATAMTFLHFAEQQVDIAVIETGMGGLLDATNIITPLVSIITNVGLDHQQWLGQTKEEIAHRKAGIIKPNTPLVTAETNPTILNIFRQTCHKKNAPFYPVQDHLTATNITSTLTHQTFSAEWKQDSPLIRGARGVHRRQKLTIPLLGSHQIANALTALLTLKVLDQPPKKSNRKTNIIGRRPLLHTSYFVLPNIQAGFSATIWEGRLQIISRSPLTLIDGAHNPEGIQSLLHFLDTTPDLPSPHTLVLGVKKEKDLQLITDKLAPRFPHIICTESNYEAFPAANLTEHLKTKLPTTHCSLLTKPNLSQALDHAQKITPESHLLLITGSLYLIGDTLRILKP